MISFNPNPRTAQEAIEQCVIVNRLLANEGILDAYGHVSVRNPENPNTFFQSRRMAPGLRRKCSFQQTIPAFYGNFNAQ